MMKLVMFTDKLDFTKKLDFVKKEISEIPEIKNEPHRVVGRSQLKDFFYRARLATRLMMQEKEIFLFIVLQWIVIGLAYYLWLQMLRWIPESVWRNDNELNNDLLNIVFLLWSFLLVGFAAYPLGILSGCIGASFFLREKGYTSSVINCLKIVLPKSLTLWSFFWIDGWITVNQILDRLPSKEKTNSVLQELLYFAWKLGTIGVLPSILNGRNLIDAGKESIILVKNHPKEALLLRGGYSFICWIVGIATYIGAVIFLFYNFSLFGTEFEVYKFYFWMGVPILISVGVILVFLRPIYIIASCAMYTQYVKEEELDLSLPVPSSNALRGLVIFLVLVIILAILYFFREPLGIMHILRVGH